MTQHTPESLSDLIAGGFVHPTWEGALQPVSAQIAEVLRAVQRERDAGEQVLPEAPLVWAVFQRPFDAVRVLIVGQDPYPTPGHAMGLAFSAAPNVRPLPRSVANLFRELHTDLGLTPATHPDLTQWADQGVMLLNRVLTVRAGAAGSHRGLGWEGITLRAVQALIARGGPLVVVLWGNDARALAAECGTVPVVESAHPSPLSASRGFFGSRPFSAVNERLRAQGAAAIEWQLPGYAEPGMLW